MKLIIHCLILFLTISITSENLLNDFSIEPFKKYLKEKGLFQIIQSILNVYGQDIAIISCEELNVYRKGNCQRLITDYMTPSNQPDLFKGKRVFDPIRGTANSPHFLSSTILSLLGIFKHSKKLPAIKNILRTRFNPWESKMIYNKIIKRFNKF